ncbi:hypothetical protein D3C87_1365890 [compost metagenome]
MRQQRPRFAAQRFDHLARQQAQERIVGQVGRITAVTQFAVQPTLQPTVMFAVKGVDLLVQRLIGGRHGGQILDSGILRECN